MIDVGYLAAFLGGLLSLLSPCSALLLPSFFALAFQSRARLLARTSVFTLGLVTTLVPLGVGAAWASMIAYDHRGLLFTVAGWALIGFGAMQAFGGGFRIPLPARLRAGAAGTSSGAVFLLGATYGFAGFCSGPILGAVLTVAATGSPTRGAALLTLYALGMAAPLLLMALLWERMDLGSRAWLRGRTVCVGRLRLHSTSVISGVLFVAVGVLLLRFQGTAGITTMAGLTDLEFAAQDWAREAGDAVPDAVVLGVGAALGGVGLRRALRRRAPQERQDVPR